MKANIAEGAGLLLRKGHAMVAQARREIVDPTEVAVYHCFSRCVRRARLCGRDELTKKDFSYRRKWIEDLTRELARHFAVEVISYSIMENHTHHELRSRPDIVERWSDEEVARRWLSIYPDRSNRNRKGPPRRMWEKVPPPNANQINALARNKDRIRSLRVRLSHISWFVGRLKEIIARRANAEDRCTGVFWEGRYKAVRLDSESAVLACAVYIDLNPIRAGVVPTPEQSRYTSVWNRIVARQSRICLLRRRRRKSKRCQAKKMGSLPLDPSADSWLTPLFDRTLPKNECFAATGHRATDDAGISITVKDYLTLLDWTGRQICGGKRGVIRSDLAPILDRLNIAVSEWAAAVESFGRWTRRVAGRDSEMAAAAARVGRRWYQGIRRCRQVFLEKPPDEIDERP